MQYIYPNRYLVVIDGDVFVYKYEKYNFDKPFLSLRAKHVFIDISIVCEKRKFSGGEDKEVFDGNTLLLERQYKEYVFISGLEIFKFKTDDKILDYISLMCSNMCPYAIIIGKKIYIFQILSI